MNQPPLILFGLLVTFAFSWYGIAVKSYVDFGQSMTAIYQKSGYPLPRPGTAQQGLQVYRANGCAACHTMQVRGKGHGSDIDWGWGKRHSVAQDFLQDNPAMVGSVRIGPDLMNIGARQASEDWHLLHLYNPRLTVERSNMPRYPYLFEKRKRRGAPSSDALKLPAGTAPTGYEIVPSAEARSLVAYLLNLQADAPLFEAPMPRSKTNAVALAGTNAPAPATNSLGGKEGK